LFCDINEQAVIEMRDADILYEVPLALEEQGLDQLVCDHLGLTCDKADMTEWKALIDKVKNLSKTVNIALVGKYVELQDAYISVVEALKHAGYYYDADVKINWINAEDVKPDNV